MSETKFTPGPWYADAKGYIWRRPLKDLYEYGGGVAGDKPLATVCKGWWGEDTTGYSVEANAHLIAAAPDMYEELECARDVFRFYQSHHEFKGGTEKAIRNKEIADRIDRLLAKARGEA